jgi:outer membrane protein OmpA-like peptidoglycan-associated protein
MMNPRTFRGTALFAAAALAAGCGPMSRKTMCHIGTIGTGAAVGALGGGIGVAQIENGPDDGEIAAGAAAGFVTGALVGGLIGLAICKEEEPPPPPSPPPPPHKVATLMGPQFDFNKATLRPDGLAAVRTAADTLRGTTERVVVTGYTDSVGSDAYNLRLSERRANSVRDALVADGIAADRITTKGMGESNPVASNDTAAGRAQNRRVDIVAQ